VHTHTAPVNAGVVKQTVQLSLYAYVSLTFNGCLQVSHFKTTIRLIAHSEIQAVFTSFVCLRLVRCCENIRSRDFLCSLLALKTAL
jgi:hypothetical protein